jgi:hypothetical protein
MKVTEHVEHLLKQGRKPKELIELGFPKSVVTRVCRQLREGKAVPQTKVPEGTGQAESHLQTPSESSDEMVIIQRKLQSMADDLERVDSLVKALAEVTVLMAAARELGTYIRETCPYERDGLCTLEAWAGEDEIPQDIGEPILVENEKLKWYIKPSPFYCAMCTASLETRLDDVESDASGNPLSGAKYQITCKGCGSKGWIATAIKCTKCGRETYWGWWPNKE